MSIATTIEAELDRMLNEYLDEDYEEYEEEDEWYSCCISAYSVV